MLRVYKVSHEDLPKLMTFVPFKIVNPLTSKLLFQVVHTESGLFLLKTIFVVIVMAEIPVIVIFTRRVKTVKVVQRILM